MSRRDDKLLQQLIELAENETGNYILDQILEIKENV